MKKFDFKKLVLMGVVAGTALSVSSLGAAGANGESSNSSQTKKTKPATRQTPTKNNNSNASTNNNRNTYNKYTADNSSYSNDPKPSPYRSAHPFDNRYAADDKFQSMQGDDSNFTVPDSYGSKNNPNNPNNPSNSNYSTRPGASAPRGNTPNAWEAAPKGNDELADNYNTNQTPYQQRMSSKNWYGDSGVSAAPSPRASDGVYYEDMTNGQNQAGNRNPSSYNNNVPQPSSSNPYSSAPRPVGNPIPVNAPSSQYSNSGPQYNTQAYPRTPAPQQSQPVQGRIMHSDNGYQSGGSSGSHGCPGGCGTGTKKR